MEKGPLNALLTIQHGALAGRSYRLGARVRVGSSPLCEVRLPDAGVNACHFVLENRGRFFLLRAEEGAPGTFVDGSRVSTHRLKDGTTIYAGDAVLFFRELDGVQPSRAEFLDVGQGPALANEVRRIYESSVTYLTDPEVDEAGRDTARTALTALYQVGRLSSSESDLGVLFEGTARILLEALRAGRCCLLLSEGDGRFRRVAEVFAETHRGRAPSPPAEVLHRSAEEGVSLLLRDASRDPRFPPGRVGSALSVPLKAARKRLGAIWCDVPPGGATFGEEDLKLATAVGRQAGGAIERLILEEQLYEHSRQLEARVEERTQKLQQALEDLKAAQGRLVLSEKLAAVGMMVQGIAHNMATPLNGILGYAQVLKARHPDLEALDEIIALCRNLDGLIENLLAKGRHDARTEPELVDLNAVVEETLKFFQADLFFKHEVRHTFVKDPDLPRVWGLWSDFSQAIQNLARNGLDAMESIPRKELEVKTGVEDGDVFVEVSDTGRGIPPQDQGKVFDPFFTTKGAKGTGLGLFTVMNLLSPYGARIAVEDRDPGTTFRITLPGSLAKVRGAHEA